MVHDDQIDRGQSTISPPSTADAVETGEARAAQPGAARLAAALGINRRTIYKLRLRGAPTGHDESAWRTWCRTNAIRTRAPLGAGIADLAANDAPRGTESETPTPSAAGASGTTGGAAASGVPIGVDAPTTMAQVKNQRDAELKVLQARKVQLEIDEKLRVLIGRDDARRILAALALTIVNELVDLPARAVQAMPDGVPPEWRRPLRRAVEQQVEGLRDRVSGSLRLRIRQLLVGPASAGAPIDGGAHAR